MKRTPADAYQDYLASKRDNPSYKAKANERTKAWVADHKTERAAHKIVERALAKGTLVKPYFCEACGVKPKRLDGHHDDYSKPLEVRWLCRGCHIAVHKGEKAKPRRGRTPRFVEAG
jgi:hypothetical protein